MSVPPPPRPGVNAGRGALPPPPPRGSIQQARPIPSNIAPSGVRPPPPPMAGQGNARTAVGNPLPRGALPPPPSPPPRPSQHGITQGNIPPPPPRRQSVESVTSLGSIPPPPPRIAPPAAPQSRDRLTSDASDNSKGSDIKKMTSIDAVLGLGASQSPPPPPPRKRTVSQEVVDVAPPSQSSPPAVAQGNAHVKPPGPDNQPAVGNVPPDRKVSDPELELPPPPPDVEKPVTPPQPSEPLTDDMASLTLEPPVLSQSVEPNREPVVSPEPQKLAPKPTVADKPVVNKSNGVGPPSLPKGSTEPAKKPATIVFKKASTAPSSASTTAATTVTKTATATAPNGSSGVSSVKARAQAFGKPAESQPSEPSVKPSQPPSNTAKGTSIAQKFQWGTKSSAAPSKMEGSVTPAKSVTVEAKPASLPLNTAIERIDGSVASSGTPSHAAMVSVAMSTPTCDAPVVPVVTSTPSVVEPPVTATTVAPSSISVATIVQSLPEVSQIPPQPPVMFATAPPGSVEHLPSSQSQFTSAGVVGSFPGMPPPPPSSTIIPPISEQFPPFSPLTPGYSMHSLMYSPSPYTPPQPQFAYPPVPFPHSQYHPLYPNTGSAVILPPSGVAAPLPPPFSSRPSGKLGFGAPPISDMIPVSPPLTSHSSPSLSGPYTLQSQQVSPPRPVSQLEDDGLRDSIGKAPAPRRSASPGSSTRSVFRSGSLSYRALKGLMDPTHSSNVERGSATPLHATSEFQQSVDVVMGLVTGSGNLSSMEYIMSAMEDPLKRQSLIAAAKLCRTLLADIKQSGDLERVVLQQQHSKGKRTSTSTSASAVSADVFARLARLEATVHAGEDRSFAHRPREKPRRRGRSGHSVRSGSSRVTTDDLASMPSYWGGDDDRYTVDYGNSPTQPLPTSDPSTHWWQRRGATVTSSTSSARSDVRMSEAGKRAAVLRQRRQQAYVDSYTAGYDSEEYEELRSRHRSRSRSSRRSSHSRYSRRTGAPRRDDSEELDWE